MCVCFPHKQDFLLNSFLNNEDSVWSFCLFFQNTKHCLISFIKQNSYQARKQTGGRGVFSFLYLL